MIVESTERHLVSHLGWIDHGAIWLFEPASTQVRQVVLGDAKYLTLHSGKNDLFAAVHHFDSNRLEISAHRIAAPEEAISRIVFSGSSAAFEGNTAIWEHLPRVYLGYYKPAAVGDYLLFLVTPRPPAVEMQPFRWFNESYDQDWQGIIGVTEVPASELVLVSVQRSSDLVLHDPKTGTSVRKIRLAGQSGNPALQFRRTAPELWANNYDTLQRLDPRNWSVRKAVRLDTRGFTGSFAFNRDETLCAVARPFSGDIIALNTKTFRVTHRAAVGRQPLDVALLSDWRVYARDWQTGDLLEGKLDRR